MRLHIVTIVLDGMHFLPAQLMTMNRLQSDWTWHIAEGVARNVLDTSWCKAIPPRLSKDGTTEFLSQLRSHPRVRVWQQTSWHGKQDMLNTMLSIIAEPGILIEVDVDEMWLPEQLDLIAALFEHHEKLQCARFHCRYFVGPNLITDGINCYGNNPGEWLRAWRFQPGQRFKTHEPPVLEGCNQEDNGTTGLTRDQTKEYGLVFDHYAYAFEHQIAFKEHYYGYGLAHMKWRALQKYEGPFPVKLKAFFPWVDERATVIKLP